MRQNATDSLLEDLTSARVIAFHQECFQINDWPTRIAIQKASGIWKPIAENHFNNSSLWDEEDQARRTDVQDSTIAQNKRRIDAYNQARNDAIEAVNEIILGVLASITLDDDAWLNSETAGSIIDRMSILSLKIKAMTFQRNQHSLNSERYQELQKKLDQLKTQEQDLAHSLDQLLYAFSQGQAYFKQYRQHKMYNDPNLNPYLNDTIQK